MSHSPISSTMPIATLVSFPFFIFGTLRTFLLNVLVLSTKETCHNIDKPSHDPLISCTESKDRFSSNWLMSSSKLQLYLKLCRFTQVLLKTKICKVESTSPSLEISKEVPFITFFWTDSVLLEVHNREGMCCAWSLITTTGRDLALSLLLLQDLMIESFSLFVSNLFFTFLSMACISSASTQVYSLVRVYHQALLLWLNILTGALIALMNRQCRSSTQDRVISFLHHVSMISPTTLCIHPILLSKGRSPPIAPMIASV
jgi:hypothetical protein